jgi:hypothetical protein
MPSIQASAKKIDTAMYQPAPQPAHTGGVTQNNAPPTAISRSPVMIASLPGLGSGPDAVLRQFNGGRNVPKSRILVP